MSSPDVFAVLANPVRRRILELLLEEAATVSALVEQFEVNRPAVSEHLQVLRNAQLVRAEKRGRERYYHIQPGRLAEVRVWLEPFERYWRERLHSLEDTSNEENP